MTRSVVNPKALQFLTPVREFVVHNATDEPVMLQYDAETRTVPPIDVVVHPHPKFDDVCFSATDSEGQMIPGTLVLRDVYVQKEMGEFGEERAVWSAANAIKHCLGIDVKTGIANGAYAHRGLSVLPNRPSPELVDQVRQEGRARYVDWRVTQARELVEAYDSRNANRARVNMQPVPPGPDYHKAIALLRAFDERQKEAMKASMARFEKEDALEPEVEVVGTAQPPEIEADPEALAALVAANPAVLEILRKQHRIYSMAPKKQKVEFEEPAGS